MTYIYLAILQARYAAGCTVSRSMPKYAQSHQTEFKLHLNEFRSNALRSFALHPSKVACPDPIFKCTDQLWFTSKNEII